jgi:uncharacterized protein/predicted aspartyl protease
MRLAPALILIGCLVSSAHADVLDGWCAQVRLPSSIAICSDTELRTLTIQRQQAFNEARGRVGEERYQALAADQSAWVSSYPKACGLASEAPAPIPLPAQIRDCMASAGRTRIAFLNAYGTSPAAPSSTLVTAAGIGPSFDCTKVTAPLSRMICSRPDLSRIDLHFAQAFWALKQQLPTDRQSALLQEDLDFLDSVLLACDIPESGPPAGSADCIAAHYNLQRARWASRLSGPAADEANRPPEQHLNLQRDLQKLGYLPQDATIDGVYGPATRTAITGWQIARGRPSTGYVGDDDARILEMQIASAADQPVSPSSTLAALPAPQPGGTSPPVAASQENEVGLTEAGGTFHVPVRINDALTLNFTVDSGASDVLIPADVMLTLVRTGTLGQADFIGKKTYQLADGTELPSMTFTLRELRVGNHRLANVQASVGRVEGGLLLGQSFLSRFKSWTFDNGRHVLILTER